MNPERRDIAAYETAYANSDFEVVQAQMRKRLLVELIERLGARRILEVGCGSDSIFLHLKQFDSCVVVEPGRHFASQARTAANADLRVEVVEGFLEDVAEQLIDRQFDLILISGLLHELALPQRILQAVQPLCRASTTVHVNVPNARSLHRVLALEMGLIGSLEETSERQRTLQQAHTFDIDQLRDLCTREGFSVVDSGSYFVKPFSHAQMANLQRMGFLDQKMIDGLYGLAKHLPGMGSEIFVNLQTTRSEVQHDPQS